MVFGILVIIGILTGMILLWEKPSSKKRINLALSPVPSIKPTQSKKAKLPSEIIDLTNWKITLPIGNSSKKPLEIRQPELSNYQIEPWFTVDSGGEGVRFRAPVNAATTKNTKYPRSELREMSDNGKTNAAWSSKEGVHTMFLDQAITKVPTIKKHVVAGQIHDSDDDIIVVRLEYPNLYINVDGKNVSILDSDYTLGKRFTVKFVVEGGQTKVYYNNNETPSYTLDLDYSGAYFKAGAYTQSNCFREAFPLFCNEDNYGEVVIYKVVVEHSN